jgi:hypothetical protein
MREVKWSEHVTQMGETTKHRQKFGAKSPWKATILKPRRKLD